MSSRRLSTTSSFRYALVAGATWTSEGVDWHEVVNIGDTTTQYLIVEVRDR